MRQDGFDLTMPVLLYHASHGTERDAGGGSICPGDGSDMYDHHAR